MINEAPLVLVAQLNTGCPCGRCRRWRRFDWVHKTRVSAPHLGMEARGNVRRLPTTHALRLKKRDGKMWRRETERAGGLWHIKSRCPCRLCPFGRPLLRTTQARHLRDYGRHPSRRLQYQVHPIHNYVTAHKSVQHDTAWRTFAHGSGIGRTQRQAGLGVIANAFSQLLQWLHGHEKQSGSRQRIILVNFI